MQDAIEDGVYNLVAEQRGVHREKLRPYTTLSYDLGIEGDDAVEFFESFDRRFAVDLRPLGQDWSRYFAPEGVGLGGIVFVLAALVVGYLFHIVVPRLPQWLAFTIGEIFWILGWYQRQRSRAWREPQISLQDLVDSAKSGKWTKQLRLPQRKMYFNKEKSASF